MTSDLDIQLIAAETPSPSRNFLASDDDECR